LVTYQLCDFKPMSKPLWTSSFLIYKMLILKMLKMLHLKVTLKSESGNRSPVPGSI
jgi:predicted acyltransferase